MHTGACIGREAPPPDGRQTRIDFVQPATAGDKKIKQTVAPKKSSFDLLAFLTSWLKPHGKNHPDADLDGFKSYLLSKNYSKKTCSSYLFMLRRFFEHFSDRSPASLTMGDIEDYNYEYFVSGRYSRSYQLQFVNAVRLYYLYSANLTLNLKHLRKTGVIVKKRV